MFIRDHLSKVGEDYPWNMWTQLKEQRALVGQKCGGILNFLVYIWWLKQLGLIELSGRTEPSMYPGRDRNYYRLVARNVNKIKEWTNPRAALYPDSYRAYHSGSRY